MNTLIRVATFNIALFGQAPGDIIKRLNTGSDAQINDAVEVLVDSNPDMVLINELDYDEQGEAARMLAARLSSMHPDLPPYASHAFPSNTGIQTGFDLVGTGSLASPENAQGFGTFPGQYGFALLSRFKVQAVRTFQHFLWQQMPGARLPDAVPGSGRGDYFSPAAKAVLRLSSKNHVDAQVTLPGADEGLHLLLSHPTPPVFDGPERRNARRNADEIRFWVDYLDDKAYLVDDAEQSGGLDRGAAFIILGDLNADPEKGASQTGAINQLLNHPRVQDPRPSSADGLNTAQFQGGMRVDFVLPSSGLRVKDSGVVWFPKNDPKARLNTASDHHLVWVDLEVTP